MNRIRLSYEQKTNTISAENIANPTINNSVKVYNSMSSASSTETIEEEPKKQEIITQQTISSNDAELFIYKTLTKLLKEIKCIIIPGNKLMIIPVKELMEIIAKLVNIDAKHISFDTKPVINCGCISFTSKTVDIEEIKINNEDMYVKYNNIYNDLMENYGIDVSHAIA